jgi:rod shape-determining protein MreD
VRGLQLLAALAAAVVLQTTLAGFLAQGAMTVDLVLVVVVYVALTAGPVAGLLAGTAGGLVQDHLSSGILGMGGLAKTLVGFLAGRFGTQFIVNATVPRFLVFAAASAAHAGLFMGAYTLLGLRSFPSPAAAVAMQALGNGVLGVVGFQLAEWLPRVLERRRSGRGMRVKR